MGKLSKSRAATRAKMAERFSRADFPSCSEVPEIAIVEQRAPYAGYLSTIKGMHGAKVLTDDLSAVYFIVCSTPDGCQNQVKIGYSVDPLSRLSNHQVSCPYELTLVTVEPGGQQREKELHDEFTECAARGEWFYASERLIEYIIGLVDEWEPGGRLAGFGHDVSRRFDEYISGQTVRVASLLLDPAGP